MRNKGGQKEGQGSKSEKKGGTQGIKGKEGEKERVLPMNFIPLTPF